MLMRDLFAIESNFLFYHYDYAYYTWCLLSPGVRPSVCLSVTSWDCIQKAEYIVKLLPRPDSIIILVFLSLSAGTQFQGEPLQ